MSVDPKRQAAALEALRTAEPARTASFRERYGGRLILLGVVLLALVVGVRLVGAFLRTSADESSRAQEELRRGLRR